MNGLLSSFRYLQNRQCWNHLTPTARCDVQSNAKSTESFSPHCPSVASKLAGQVRAFGSDLLAKLTAKFSPIRPNFAWPPKPRTEASWLARKKAANNRQWRSPGSIRIAMRRGCSFGIPEQDRGWRWKSNAKREFSNARTHLLSKHRYSRAEHHADLWPIECFAPYLWLRSTRWELRSSCPIRFSIARRPLMGHSARQQPSFGFLSLPNSQRLAGVRECRDEASEWKRRICGATRSDP